MKRKILQRAKKAWVNPKTRRELKTRAAAAKKLGLTVENIGVRDERTKPQ